MVDEDQRQCLGGCDVCEGKLVILSVLAYCLQIFLILVCVCVPETKLQLDCERIPLSPRSPHNTASSKDNLDCVIVCFLLD